MIRGGYKIIDLKDKELTLSVGMTYDGIYDAIEGTRKPLLISGLNIAGVEYKDFYALPKVNQSSYVITIDGYTITIQDTDVVTVATI